jgi:hypothetical protein
MGIITEWEGMSINKWQNPIIKKAGSLLNLPCSLKIVNGSYLNRGEFFLNISSPDSAFVVVIFNP